MTSRTPSLGHWPAVALAAAMVALCNTASAEAPRARGACLIKGVVS